MEGASSVLPLPLLVHDLGTWADDSLTQFSISGQALSTAAIDELRNYRCFETPQGWVLALDPASLQTFLWRPQDGQRISLPSMKKDLPMNCKCLLSDKPSASICGVLVLDLDHPDMWVCQIGGSEWDSYDYEVTTGANDEPWNIINMAVLRGIAAVGGKIYYTFAGYDLGVVEFSPELNLTCINSVDMVDPPESTPWCSTYLVESCGELFMVVILFLGQNVHRISEVAVYKMDFSRPEWCKVDRIDDRVFLLGGDRIGASNFGASCSANEHGLCGNCIYFVNNIAAEENYLHIFNLEKGTEEVQRPFKHNGYPLPLRPPFWLLTTEE